MSDRAKAYKEAGVDIDAANKLVERIKKTVASTYTRGVLSGIGGFGGLFKPDVSDMKSPVLVAGTDGVGTKLKLAFAFGRHDTIGIDLVAMSVNDVLVQGAKPLFFLDYFATGKLDPGVTEAVIQGVAEGCRQSGCALLGGETAEMPGFYPDGEYDLSGFCVGLVDEERLVDGRSVRPGEAIVGLASSGLHSNGYSLVRKLFDASGAKPGDILPGSKATFAEALLAPTRIYATAVHNLMRDLDIKGMVHVTGGGFYDNVPRILPEGVGASFDFTAWEKPPVFHWLREQGNLSWPEMLQIFNCGLGYLVMVKQDVAEDVVSRLSGMDIPAWIVGKTVKAAKGQKERVEISGI